jgi:hypothetical protein
LSIEKRSMKNRLAFAALLAATLQLACAAEPGSATNGCAAFQWNIARELAVMRAPAIPVIASANDGGSAAPLSLERHYLVSLPPQGEVRFAVPPARAARDPAPRGGSVSFAVAAAGRYRVAITSAHWIDMIAAGKAIDSVDHQGHADCELLHKVVEFELPANQPLILQLSGGAQAEVGLAITKVSPGG